MTQEEYRTLARLALGRILRIGSRSFQPGDIEEYQRCRSLFLDAVDEIDFHRPSTAPNWVVDRLKGAAGG